MKKHLFLIVRLGIAAAGIAYILGTLTWVDQVLVPQGETVLGQPLVEARAFSITRGTKLDFDEDRSVLIDVDGQLAPVPVDRRGTSEQDYQFRPSVLTILHGASLLLLFLGWLVIAPIYPVQGFRWLLLMRARGLNVNYAKSFRLVMVGSFFNYCMPGSTGGDVVKAYYAAKGSGRRADAVISVIVDRIAGLSGLIIVGCIAGLFMLDHPVARGVTVILWSLAAVLMIGGAIYFSRRLRKALRIDRLISLLPGKGIFVAIDQAMVAYRDHVPAVMAALALSVFVHCCIITGTILAGLALGIGQPIGVMAAVIPLLLLVAAVPITYQGLGFMEAAGQLLVRPGLCTVNQMIGMLMLFRLYLVVYSLLGAVYVLRGGIHMHPQADDGDAPATADGAMPG